MKLIPLFESLAQQTHAPDQMFALRGFENCPGGRTPVRGLYLGGSSAPLGPIATCAAGAAAAAALAADLEAGLLK